MSIHCPLSFFVSFTLNPKTHFASILIDSFRINKITNCYSIKREIHINKGRFEANQNIKKLRVIPKVSYVRITLVNPKVGLDLSSNRTKTSVKTRRTFRSVLLPKLKRTIFQIQNIVPKFILGIQKHKDTFNYKTCLSMLKIPYFKTPSVLSSKQCST